MSEHDDEETPDALLDAIFEARQEANTDETPLAVVNWADLYQNYDPNETWEKVVYWVNWWSERFEVPSAALPKCWAQHGYLIERVTALRDAWLLSYNPDVAAQTYPHEWLNQHDHAVEMMKRYVDRSGCSAQRHDPKFPHAQFDPSSVLKTIAPPSDMSPDPARSQPDSADQDGNRDGS